MSDYFSTPERIEALEASAAAWIGTPYVVSGAVRGSGASCHRLAGAILAGAGFPIPPVPEKGATRLREFTAVMRAWLDSQPAFNRVDTDSLKPGDILLCEHGIGHIGLVIPGGLAIQVLRSSPTHTVSLADPSVRERILAAYRPTESNGQ
jgi:cell wall-associated NlpC family hydrolase